MTPRPPRSTLFPYTTLFRSAMRRPTRNVPSVSGHSAAATMTTYARCLGLLSGTMAVVGGIIGGRSEEHTSELQSQSNLVCRLLLEKKKQNKQRILIHHNTHH